MKDPLQYTRSPYEILGVQINADSKQIFSAFIASTAKPGTDKSEIKRAFDILSNPQKGLLWIFFFIMSLSLIS